MPSEPRRIWGGVLVPADLHAALGPIVGPRGLNGAVEEGLRRLLAEECGCDAPRPARDGGSITITVRVPVPLADAADLWRTSRDMTRQALVEYALLAVLKASTTSDTLPSSGAGRLAGPRGHAEAVGGQPR